MAKEKTLTAMYEEYLATAEPDVWPGKGVREIEKRIAMHETLKSDMESDLKAGFSGGSKRSIETELAVQDALIHALKWVLEN